MKSLSAQDLRRILECVRTLYLYRNMETFISEVIRVLPTFIQADLATYTEYRWQSPIIRFEHFPDSFPVLPHAPDIMTRFPTGQGAVKQHWAQMPLQTVITLSDVKPLSFGHHDECSNDFSVPQNIPFLMATRAFDDGNQCIPLGLHRTDKKFSSHEQALLHTIQPHIAHAFLNARQVTHWEHMLHSISHGAEHIDQAAIIFSTQGRILWMTDRARQVLCHYATGHHWDADRLPNPFWDWARQQDQVLDQADLAPTAHPILSLQQGLRALTARLMRNGEQRLLLCEETNQAQNWEAFKPFQLTTREREVLGWVLEGKSNPEMSRILGAQAGTIQKHLGSIYRKLGVEHRAALLAYAWKLLKS